ncbi:MAG: hypothetical protein IT298_06260 [Chloroflexi bacterium]|jgi:hypothetical protein|nr:MAG: hypothetical protein UZ13_00354 [Chloroflexi bacterium OLB13]MBC6956039.1 hypothetical protein [Chloroflexota bacterium]MBV6437350.1 hypothetical protein [Anaerolineae bacterium]MDL1915574.1 hypothetical protein [Anaerolineae bacterium CFX4]OQY81217.1 MAG: hypothetical protein B6D42_11595 [Anaerolineae bacterium UTCFX5]
MWSATLFSLFELDLLGRLIELYRLEESHAASVSPYDSAVVFMAADIFEDRLGFGLDELEEPDLDRLFDDDWTTRTTWASCVDAAQRRLIPTLRAC